MQLLDDFKGKKRNWNLKEEALDHTSGELALEGAMGLSQERILSMTGSSVDPVPFQVFLQFFLCKYLFVPCVLLVILIYFSVN
jgi:hypothetical protein